MGSSLKGQTWGNKSEISDSTVKIMMAYYYAHSTGVFTDEAHAMGVDDVWGPEYTWYMNAWVQACIWRYQQGSMGDPVTACAEELMAVYNSLKGTHYTSIDDELDGRSFRDRTQFILDGGAGLWGDCKVYLYSFTGSGSQAHPASSVQKVILGELKITEITELIFDNLKQPLLKISKIEKGTGTKIPGTVFLLEAIDGDYRHEVTTEANGSVELRVAPGSYRITEQSVPEPYYISDEPTQTISLNGGDEKEVIFQNLKKPELTLSKIDADTKEPIPGTVLRVEAINGDYQDDWTTGPDGKVTKYVTPGTYRVTEISVPSPWYLPDKDADRVQTISLNPGDVKELVFRNRKEPEITIFKEDSVAGAPVEGAKFHVTYTSNGEASDAPASADYGYLFTDANGEIKLHEQGKKLYPGEYTITEVAPPPGFQMKEPSTQTVILHGNESKTITFQNEPLNAIIVEKYDSVTHEALPGCTFQLRFLGGTSGTGGTVIGQKVTGKNGTCIWTGLTAGTYICEELDPADGYSIIKSSETVYLADSGEQSVVTVRFDNSPDGSLLIRKVCSVNPSITLRDAEFKVTYADGTLIGDSNGIYRSDENGEVRISGLKPGKSVVVTEVRAPDGFILDTQSQTVQIKEGRTVSLTFKNQPRGKLIIQKRDSISGQPLSGAQFRLTTAAGCEVGLDGVIGTATLTQNGIFTTDSNGEIRVSNLAPGALILTEIKAPAGYVIDNPSTNIMIGPNGDTQTVIVTDTPKGGLVVEKYDKITKQPLAGARFKIVYSNGELLPDNEGLTSSNGLYTTDVNGQIVISKVQPGTLVVTEDKAPDFYQKDPTPQTVVVNAGDTQTLRFYDDPLCTLTILKRDAVTHKPLSGGQFLVQYSDGHVVGPNNGLYTTGTDGTVTVSGLRPNATVMVSEQKAPKGYILDQTPKNIVVRSGVANGLIFDDQPGTTLIIQKFIEGTENEPLNGVAFKVTDGAGAAVGPDDGVYYTDHAGEIVLSGIEPGTTVKAREIKTVDLVDTIRSDKNGLASSRPLPLGRYKVVESQSAEFYGLDKTPMEAEIEFSGQIVRLAMTNKALYTNVSINKRGYAQVMPGQAIRYDFTGIANNSTTALSSFYWRDTLPSALRLDRIVTGTYNVQGNYKIVYKTNLSGETYRVIDDNVSTTKNSVVAASPAALGLASGEYVTEVMFVFGVVPSNFRQVEAPQIHCNVVSWLKGGAQFVNQADVGGVHNEQWIMATDRWVTTVYKPAKPSKPLPRTGY